jgi:MFS family permease
MMVYGLSIILVAPIVAKLADQRTDRLQFVVFGGFIAALAMAVPDVFQGTTGVILSMIGLGVGHAICVSAQMTLINDRCGVLVEEVGQASTIAIFRLIERTGSILGPIIFGTLITFSSYSYTFAIMAIFSMLSTSIIAFFLSSFAKRVPLFQKS